jgi:septation ring formation regulator EzrA
MLSVMHKQNIQTEYEREKPDEQTLADLKKKLQATESENKTLSDTRANIQRQLQASEGDLESAQHANRQMRQQIAEQVQEKLQAQLTKFLNLQKEFVKVNSELRACKSSLDDSAILFYFLLRLMVTPT